MADLEEAAQALEALAEPGAPARAEPFALALATALAATVRGVLRDHWRSRHPRPDGAFYCRCGDVWPCYALRSAQEAVAPLLPALGLPEAPVLGGRLGSSRQGRPAEGAPWLRGRRG